MASYPLKSDDLIEDVVREYPSASAFLRQWGIICIQCGEPVWGTLQEVIEEKKQNVTEVLQALNNFIKQTYPTKNERLVPK